MTKYKILILKFNSNQSLKGEPEPGELNDNESTAQKEAVKIWNRIKIWHGIINKIK